MKTPTQFINDQYSWQGFKDRVLPYITDEKKELTLIPYTLPKNMSDTDIKKETKSKPIDVKYFASVVQSFTKDADKSKYYIFHVQTPKKVVAVYLDWNDDEWGVNAYDFVYGFYWNVGSVFLSFATDTETLSSSETLTLGSLETRIEKLENWARKLSMEK